VGNGSLLEKEERTKGKRKYFMASEPIKILISEAVF
jgi:hypothetical protein